MYFFLLGLQKRDVVVRLPMGTTSAAFRKLAVTWNLLGMDNFSLKQ